MDWDFSCCRVPDDIFVCIRIRGMFFRFPCLVLVLRTCRVLGSWIPEADSMGPCFHTLVIVANQYTRTAASAWIFCKTSGVPSTTWQRS